MGANILGVIRWESYDNELEEFVEKNITSLLTWGLFILLYHNPGIRDSLEGFARRLGRKASDLDPYIQQLVRKKIIQKITDGQQEYYIYDPPLEIEKEIGRFVQAIENRDTRLHILTKVLKSQE